MKLIASDMDGTLLLNGSQQVSEEAAALIEKLIQKDFLFVAASGRQYANLRRQFARIANQIAYICENGAVVIYQGNVLYESVMDRELALSIIRTIHNKKGCEVLISSKNYSYINPKSDTFLNRMQNIVKNDVRVISDFSQIIEPIVKVSVYEEAGIVEHSGSYFINAFQDKVKCTVSGYGWLDFVNLHVNKGASLQALMKELSISSSDCYAFGDNFNDIEMLQAVTHPYLMETAPMELKKRFPVQIKRVEEELNRLLLNS